MNIIIREYNPSTGSLMGNVDTLSWGRVTSGTHTGVRVFDIAFEGVTYVSNIRIGLINSGGLLVNSNPTGINPDGSASNGHFGIQYSDSFDVSIASSSLTRHFGGLNANVSPTSAYNVSVPNRGLVLSEFIYLDAEIDVSSIARSGSYKVFFDYS